eukprot:TRINITY_DN531_c0_g2_i1.p1 TRINITY_DN531_c0_g2~~TRINITY_DN531_c0_g2_i1.p1  ORF type:complete len:441 (+),score=28.68 TRINITY_DN531_c0_g2_i1:126-1448(+)
MKEGDWQKVVKGKKGQRGVTETKMEMETAAKDHMTQLHEALSSGKKLVTGGPATDVSLDQQTVGLVAGAELRTSPFILTADNATKGCNLLLQEFVTRDENRIYDSYRIELRHGPDKSWVLALRVPVGRWYEHRAKDLPVKAVGDYVTMLRDLSHAIGVVQYFEELPGPVATYCETPNPEVCPYTNKGEGRKCNKKHPKNYCSEKKVARRDGQGPCNWKVADELLVCKAQGYVLAARREATRDLLLCPTNHKSNFDIAKSDEFWGTTVSLIGLIQTTDEKGVELVALNFGKWETEQSKDDMAISCHGHAHVFVSAAIISHLGSFSKAAQGRYFRPEAYYESEANVLEPRLVRRECEELTTKIDDTRSSLVSVKNKMDSMENKMDSIENKMNSMENKMNSMENKMNSIIDTLNVLSTHLRIPSPIPIPVSYTHLTLPTICSV